MYDLSKYQYTPPHLSCPRSKFNNKEDEFGFVQFGQLPTVVFSSRHHISPLDNFSCRFCKNSLSTTPFYSFKNCVCKFHKECVEPISNHPYHPKHSLRLCHYTTLPGPYTTLDKKVWNCLFCSHDRFWFYSCSLCDFRMCQSCARKPPLLAIDNPKRHEHTLFYFPRKGSLFCDICALNDHKYSIMYYCSQCDFFVHKDCIYLPYIIRISRHEHRLSFSSLLTPDKWLCGVCRVKIDTNYGRYSCVKGCNFSVHSKCATREDVWDGKELEGEPEDDVLEDISSFIEISDGVIQHFSHQCHHMRLDKDTSTVEFDKENRCRACTLPIYDDDVIIYKCVECYFILHQKCAHLPRKREHPLHSHPLSLQEQDDGSKGWFFCKACERISNGFKYKCFESGCKFRLDIYCSYVSEPFNYWYHPHSLFLTHTPKSQPTCSICKSQRTCLTCGECSFELCFRCATLPKKLRYKHDEHFLIHWYDEDASDQYCCDVCETKADPKKDRVYMCDDCNVMVHIKCLLGDMDMYVMPGRIIRHESQNINILSNNRLTRNICQTCHNRCQGYIIYKVSNEVIFCSVYCIR